MITLKAVLVGSSCAGVLAIGGGITYATVGDSHPTQPSHPKAPVAKQTLAAPERARPACLPNAGDIRRAVPQPAQGVPNVNVPNVPNAGAAAQQAQQQVRQVAQQAQQRLQQQGEAAPAAVPAVPAATNAPSVPGTDCVSVPSVPSVAPRPSLPAESAVPSVPKLPGVPKVSCDSIEPAVALGSQVERSVILTHGLSHGTKHVRVITYKAHKLCSVSEKWVGQAGQWLQIERVQVPKALAIGELHAALRLPAGGVPVNVAGHRGVATPLGGGVLWYSGDGFALCVTGSTAYATQLQAVAAQVQQQI